MAGRLHAVAPLGMLFQRLVCFALVQALFALGFWCAGSPSPWEKSIAWWPISVLATNLISIPLLASLLRAEGTRYFAVFRFQAAGWWKDLLIALGLLVLMAPIAQIPNALLAKALFGSPEAVQPLMFRALPTWAVVLSIAFPITHVFAELPVYFGYAMPRLARRLKSPWLAWLIAALALALQHVTMPLIFDPSFIVWRGLMFIPFALALGFCVMKRPTLLPYFMVGHGLIDSTLIVMLFMAR